MRNNFYINCSDIKDDEWRLLDSLPKHLLYRTPPVLFKRKYIGISAEGELIDKPVIPKNHIRIYNLPEFIEKFNEFRFFLLL